jgi:hypothetical protein
MLINGQQVTTPSIFVYIGSANRQVIRPVEIAESALIQALLTRLFKAQLQRIREPQAYIATH